MPKKWIRNAAWQRQPHNKDGPPASLWWHRRPDRQRVIAAYLERASKGRTVPADFEGLLSTWLADLSKLQNKKRWGQPRTYRYWDVPSYARDNGFVKKATLMKYLRELEKIAKQMFPNDVPSGRKTRAPLTEKELQEIKQRYLKGEDAKKLADAFRIPASQVGRLCREEKVIRAAERERAQQQTTDEIPPSDITESFL